MLSKYDNDDNALEEIFFPSLTSRFLIVKNMRMLFPLFLKDGSLLFN